MYYPKQILNCITFLLLVLIAGVMTAYGQVMDPVYYDIGTVNVRDVYVDPQNGNDGNDGSTRQLALRTISEAWTRIPQSQTLTQGYRIQLVRGTYSNCGDIPVYWESRHGTKTTPIIFQAADGDGTVTINCGWNVFDCTYFYAIGLKFICPDATSDAGHYEKCDHILLRNCTFSGHRDNCQEGLKANQSTNVFVENCDISAAWDNAVDFVSVQYGHVVGCKIHNCGDWAMYLKGGSAYFRVEGNELYNAGTGGFTAGQGTGFQFMTSPWIHYEAYDIKFINNIIHDCEGAGIGAQGGYNILYAYNTMYRVGSRSHIVEAGFGSRSCDGQANDPGHAQCATYLQAGGWGNTRVDDGSNFTRIPNKNIFIYNNIIYNPSGFQSQWQHFSVMGAYSGEYNNGSNVPSPALADNNLQIKGNIIWNGPADHALGLDDQSGCQNTNPTCNETQLRSQNAINTIEPQLTDPAAGNFRPRTGSNVFTAQTYSLPSFTGNDRPSPPTSPAGNYTNTIDRDRDGKQRSTIVPGAYASSTPAAVPVKSDGSTGELRCVPNPATGTATLRFTLAHAGDVTFVLYDMLGRRIATMTREGFDAGEHEITLTSLLQSVMTGSYIIELNGERVQRVRVLGSGF